jgi:2-polyprenyl-6-methoxyphenol hydroxylase-like FAD-dependent oxidoreductase
MRGFDAIILGGGPAGGVTAMLLARQGFAVAVVDRPSSRPFAIGETLPPQASRLIGELDLMDRFRLLGPLASSGIISVWGSETPQVNDFIFSVHGNGWHIDRSAFNGMLTDAAADAGATIFQDARIDAIEPNHSGWRVAISTPEARCVLESRFMVDARGRAARASFGFPGRIVFDSLIAVAGFATPRRSRALSDFTLIEAVDQGWFYSAFLPCGQYIVVFLTDSDIYSFGHARSNDFVALQLAKAPGTLERIDAAPESFTVFSAATSIREAATCPNWLAVGDAAMSYDPLSGQGLWGAMTMSRRAASSIALALEGKDASLAPYEQENRVAFARYLRAHNAYYRSEGRWPESSFWRRRHETHQDHLHRASTTHRNPTAPERS